MFEKIRHAAMSMTLAATVAIVSLGASPAAARADGLYFSFGQSHPRVVERYGHRHHFRHRRAGRICTPRHAVRKAERLGIHRAHVVRANRRVIRVLGHRHHRRVGIVFARAPGCPVVR